MTSMKFMLYSRFESLRSKQIHSFCITIRRHKEVMSQWYKWKVSNISHNAFALKGIFNNKRLNDFDPCKEKEKEPYQVTLCKIVLVI